MRSYGCGFILSKGILSEIKPKSPQESFYGSYLYNRIVPADRLIRKINQVVNFSFKDQVLNNRHHPEIGKPAKASIQEKW
jgi:hypothetical protein